jgi:hypothetical protein
VEIAEMQKAFAAREKLARDVEVAVEKLGEVWDRLLKSRAEIITDWPSDLFPMPRQDQLKSRIDRELAWSLWAAGRPGAMRPCAIPAPSNEGLGVAGISPRGIAGAIAQEHETVLAELRALPLPDDKPAEEAAA